MARSATVGNTLLYAPDRAPDTEAAISQTLSTPNDSQLLVVSYREGPDTWLRTYHAHTQTWPADFGFIDVGGTTRSAAVSSTPSASHSSPAQDSPTPTVTAVSNPADLTELGIQISQYLEQWSDTTHPTVIYLDSLTALLDAVDLNRAYRFLHVLSGRIASVDGHAYYQLNPDAIDAQTIAVIRDLMDDIVQLTPSAESDDHSRPSPPP